MVVIMKNEEEFKKEPVEIKPDRPAAVPNRCVCCGEEIPEGRMVCHRCEVNA